LQDRELLSFFLNLIKFRKKYLPIIKDSALHYQAGNIHQWHLSGSAGHLVAVYSGTQPAKLDIPGVCIFGPSADLAQYQAGELPPYTLLVYEADT
jgi:hypothetical protein